MRPRCSLTFWCWLVVVFWFCSPKSNNHCEMLSQCLLFLRVVITLVTLRVGKGAASWFSWLCSGLLGDTANLGCSLRPRAHVQPWRRTSLWASGVISFQNLKQSSFHPPRPSPNRTCASGLAWKHKPLCLCQAWKLGDTDGEAAASQRFISVPGGCSPHLAVRSRQMQRKRV